MDQDLLQQWFMEVPPVTRGYLVLVVLTSLACQLDLVSPFHLYFNWDLIVKGRQWWRLVTSFAYYGNLGVDFLFHLFFLARYSRALEEASFRGRTGDFLWMLFLVAGMIVLIVPLLPTSSLPFLSSPLTFFLVYLWSRRNPHVRMNLLGLFTFTAPYLPFVLLAFSLFLNNVWPTGDLVGMAVGHLVYFVEDVWPKVLEAREASILASGNSGNLLDPNNLPSTRVKNLFRAPHWFNAIVSSVSGGGNYWNRLAGDARLQEHDEPRLAPAAQLPVVVDAEGRVVDLANQPDEADAQADEVRRRLGVDRNEG